jgi:hypothetical protein
VTLRRAAALGPRAGHHRPAVEEVRRFAQEIRTDPSLAAAFARMRIQRLRDEAEEHQARRRFATRRG